MQDKKSLKRAIRAKVSAPLWLSVSTLVMAPAVLAQEANTDQEDQSASETTELTPIDVAGTTGRGTLARQASDIDVLAGREKERKQAANLGESLDHLAGINVIGTGNGVGKPVIRGLSGVRVKTLQDGIGVEHQQFGVRHPPNIDPFLTDRIEVVRGAQSVLYGSDALGGVINAVSRPVRYNTPVYGTAMSSYASNNGQWSNGLRIGAGSERAGVLIEGLHRSAGNMETPSATTYFPPPPAPEFRDAPAYSGELDHTDFDQMNVRVAAGLRHAGNEYTVSYRSWQDDHNFLLPPPAGILPPPAGQEGIGQWLDDDVLRLDADLQLAGLAWRPVLMWQNNRRRSNAPGYPRQFGFDGTLDIEFDKYTARLEGFNGPVLGLDGGRFGFEYSRKEQVSRGPTQLTPGGEVDTIGVFAFQEKTLGDWLLQIGLRYDQRDVEALVSETASPSPAVIAAEGKQYDVFSGSLGAVYDLSQNWSLAANLSRGYRAPTLFELYVDGVHGGVAALQQGDPNLSEETSLNSDIALRYANAQTQASLTLYRNAIDDFIYIFDTGEQAPNGLPVFEFSQQDAVLQGVEIAVDHQLTQAWSVSASAEMVDGEFDRNNDELPLLPADNASLGVEFAPAEWLGLNQPYVAVDLRWKADKSAVPGEPFSQFDGAPFGQASTDAYSRFDVAMGFAPVVGEHTWSVDLKLRNVLDREYRDFLDTYKGYALSPGRDISLSVSIPFGG